MAIPENRPDSPELSVVSTDVEAPSTDPAPYLSLEICRGKTSYPQRPVCAPNFVIGSGPSCDLRLGSEEIPDAHSALIQTEKDVHLLWLGEAPELLLNGEPIQETVVSEGDQIGIGRFAFIVHRVLANQAFLESQAPKTAPDDAGTTLETASLMNLLAEAPSDQPQEPDPSEMTARELAAHMEAAQESVDEFESLIQKGEEALLFAAAQRAADLAEDNSSTEQHTGDSEPAEEEILEELEKVIHQLSGFSSELDERAIRLADQEATQAEAADLLLEAQKELAAQLERFHQQVSESQTAMPAQEPAPPKLRRAA